MQSGVVFDDNLTRADVLVLQNLEADISDGLLGSDGSDGSGGKNGQQSSNQGETTSEAGTGTTNFWRMQILLTLSLSLPSLSCHIIAHSTAQRKAATNPPSRHSRP